MQSLLDRGAALLESVRSRHLSRSVTYLRGEARVDVQAAIGRTTFEQVDACGVLQRSESRDYLFAAAELVLGGSATLPQAGDRVRETDGAQILLYEVMAPGGAPPWRYSDTGRRLLRVHTKFLGPEREP